MQNSDAFNAGIKRQLSDGKVPRAVGPLSCQIVPVGQLRRVAECVGR